MDRKDLILKHIDKNMVGIEIGPSYNPTCPKRDGWKVYTVDHAERDELIRKYEELPGVSQIEEVDFVWRKGSLATLVKEGGIGQVDFIIASHVIEHTPCLVSFLQSLKELLNEGGIISLAVPDKRREMDFFKPLSTTADAVEAYQQKRARHTVRTGFLKYFYNCLHNGANTWGIPADIRGITLTHDFDKALDLFNQCDFSESSLYTDCHAWFFVPASFELILLELNRLGLTKLIPYDIYGPIGCEFYVYLKHGVNSLSLDSFSKKRIDLLRKIHSELNEPRNNIIKSLISKVKNCFSVL